MPMSAYTSCMIFDSSVKTKEKTNIPSNKESIGRYFIYIHLLCLLVEGKRTIPLSFYYVSVQLFMSRFSFCISSSSFSHSSLDFRFIIFISFSSLMFSNRSFLRSSLYLVLASIAVMIPTIPVNIPAIQRHRSSMSVSPLALSIINYTTDRMYCIVYF